MKAPDITTCTPVCGRVCYALFLILVISCSERDKGVAKSLQVDTNQSLTQINYPVKKQTIGLVNNEITAKIIAEAVWLQAFGSIVQETKPYQAELRDSNTWYVHGVLDSNRVGGVPQILIQAMDGKILECFYDR